MSPRFKEQSIVWVCKLPQCASNAKELEVVLGKLHNGDVMLRKILAMPGDSIKISDKGKVITPYRNFKWKNEDAFIQTRSFYVPKKGDSLYFDQLNDVEQDYLISYLRNKGENIFVHTTLWQGDREINIDRVGATKIANRQVSLKEIDFLPWQDRYLIELQIRQSEPGNSPITIKRTLYRRPKEPVTTLTIEQDSTVDISLSAPQVSVPNGQAKQNDSSMVPPPKEAPTPESNGIVEESAKAEMEKDTSKAERINLVVIDKDCFFLACEKGSNCPDSRELGYFTSDRIIGLHLKKPDQFKNKFIEPARIYIRAAKTIAIDFWHKVSEKVSQIFKSDEEPSEQEKPET